MKLFIRVFLGLLMFYSSIAMVRADEIIEGPHVPRNVQKHFYRSDLDIQILLSGPRVTDLRNEPVDHNTFIVVGPNKTFPAINKIVNLPGDAPLMQSGLHAGLPAAGFQTNISPNNSPRCILPLDKRLHSLNTPEVTQSQIQAKQPQALKQVLATNKSTILQYHAVPVKNHGSTNLEIRTAVKGELKPGALLNRR